jgi:hypothetical protein
VLPALLVPPVDAPAPPEFVEPALALPAAASGSLLPPRSQPTKLIKPQPALTTTPSE